MTLTVSVIVQMADFSLHLLVGATVTMVESEQFSLLSAREQHRDHTSKAGPTDTGQAMDLWRNGTELRSSSLVPRRSTENAFV
jgi:hypothetical protein